MSAENLPFELLVVRHKCTPKTNVLEHSEEYDFPHWLSIGCDEIQRAWITRSIVSN